jgi:transcriptional regulator with XRE-family HTH domain
MTGKLKPLLSRNIIAKRQIKGWNAEVLAEKAEIPYPTLRDIEVGKSGGSKRTLIKVANALGCTYDELFMLPMTIGQLAGLPPKDLELDNRALRDRIKLLEAENAALKAKLEAAAIPPHLEKLVSLAKTASQSFIDSAVAGLSAQGKTFEDHEKALADLELFAQQVLGEQKIDMPKASRKTGSK